MAPQTESVAAAPGAGTAPVTGADRTASGSGERATASGATPAAPANGEAALVVRESGAVETARKEAERDSRLDELAMQVDVMVKVHSFHVRDLLAMEKGTVVETVQEHSQDVPVRCGGALLLWAEFEVLDQRLAVRMTRLA